MMRAAPTTSTGDGVRCVAGNIRNCLKHWVDIITDPEILSAVQVYEIEFESGAVETA